MNCLSLKQAAEILGCTEKKAASLAKEGKIKAVYVGHWVVSPDFLDDIFSARFYPNGKLREIEPFPLRKRRKNICKKPSNP